MSLVPDLTSLLPYAHPSVAGVRPLTGVLAPRAYWSPAELRRVTRQFTRHAAAELHRTARFDPDRRWYTRLAVTEQVEMWLLTWTPGQGTGPHHHSGSSGGYTVLYGELTETWRDGAARSRQARRRAGAGSGFGPDRVHTMANLSQIPAISVHAYSPPLLPMGTGVSLPDPPG